MTEANKNSVSYKQGFRDATEKGYGLNPYDKQTDAENHFNYDAGYDAGIVSYCRKSQFNSPIYDINE
jgi:hypothetical protein